MKARKSARLFLGCAAFALAGCTGRAPVVGPEGRRPIPLQTFWAGLPLRPPLEGRIAMPGGSFVMGSSPLEIERAMLSCKSEQLGVHCEESAEIQQELRAEARLEVFDNRLLGRQRGGPGGRGRSGGQCDQKL